MHRRVGEGGLVPATPEARADIDGPSGPFEVHFETPSARLAAARNPEPVTWERLSHIMQWATSRNTGLTGQKSARAKCRGMSRRKQGNREVNLRCRVAHTIKALSARLLLHTVEELRHNSKGQQHLRLAQHPCAPNTCTHPLILLLLVSSICEPRPAGN
jgi:hypothetical protein